MDAHLGAFCATPPTSPSAGKKSRIPDEYLQGASKMERLIFHKLDIAEQVNDELVWAIRDVRDQNLDISRRVADLEKDNRQSQEVIAGVKRVRKLAIWVAGMAGMLLWWVVDHLVPKWLALALAVMVVAGCAHRPAAPPVYTKPSVVPVAVPVATAREAIGQTRGAIGETRKAVTTARASAASGTAASTKAAELAKDLAEKTAAAKTEEAKALATEAADLQAQVTEFRNDITRITLDLDEAEQKAQQADEKAAVAEKAAQEAQEQIGKLDQQISAQTVTLNQTAQDLASEQAARKTAEAAQHRAEAALGALRVKVGIAIVLLLLVVGASFYFKFVRLGL